MTKTDFADVIKDCEMGELPWVIQMGLSVITCIPVKEAEGELAQIEEEETV